MEQFRRQIEELAGLYFIKLTAVMAMIEGNAASVCGLGIIVETSTDSTTPHTAIFDSSHFVPHSIVYYKRIWSAIMQD
ncbi:hypothetical protein [Paenibacillus sp. UMB4589-SE434]|uniref:hypothetical protein n=1 Tax=Paenibacillus sp. UMB4589-SE434 TaxID=3046314 RepID=UPI002551AE35|nr:hypothetical protein [Paenibacillus sp. UMB4589-SE434]MDK8180539.1 hypothetical protein [Paenibacillus sp. UMB4589-SE434]